MLHCVNDYYRYFLGFGLRVQGTVVYLRFLEAKEMVHLYKLSC